MNVAQLEATAEQQPRNLRVIAMISWSTYPQRTPFLLIAGLIKETYIVKKGFNKAIFLGGCRPGGVG